MPVGAVIGGGLGAVGSIAGSAIQAKGAKQAAKTQLAMYNDAKSLSQPYTDVGKGAIYSLAQLYGLPTPNNPNGGQPFGPEAMDAFTKSPDYAFALQQGQLALDRSAAAKGLLLSGSQVKGAQEFGQGLATQNFGNYFNRLLSMAQLGGQSAGTQLNAAVGAGGNIGQSEMAAATAMGGGIVGATNALTGGINQLAFYNALNPIKNTSSYQYPMLTPGMAGTAGPSLNGQVPWLKYGPVTV